ncbi:cytochrome P450 [Mycena galopus ATCC 62051]|nr:cytochrome P450 [Mycena galopus ATCC 62051]
MFTLSYSMNYGATPLGIAFVVAIYLVYRRRSAIRNIPGPLSPSWIFGHMLQLLLPTEYGDHEFNWQRLYGPVYRLKGCFGQDRLMVSDPLALQHVLNSNHFEHGPSLDTAVSLLFEEKCVMAAKGEMHRHLRAAMHIGFTAAAVRKCQPVFEAVVQVVTEQLEEFSAGLPTDIIPIISEATLNVISQAVLSSSTKDLGADFVLNNAQIMGLASSQSAVQILADVVAARVPNWIWRAAMHLPTTTFKIIHTAKCSAREIGERTIREKVEAGWKGETDVFDRLLEFGHSEKRNALTKEEVVAQTELARHPEFQEDLRAEIHHFRRNQSDGFVYDNMPLLNAFIKETLRLHPAGPLQERVAVQDTVIPLTANIKTSTGEPTDQIMIHEGQVVYVAIASYQRLETLWGEDAHEFRPSRWLDGTAYQGQALGPYANLLSFLGGPRVCLGWRFAILEMQVFFFELVCKFSFAVPKDVSIRARFANTLIPVVENGEKGEPLCINRI